METLYKMSSTGAILEWNIEVPPGAPVYTIIHGQMGGKMQSTTTNITRGKNIGRANETTAQEQCLLEAQSLWNKQKDRKGYSKDIPTEKPLRPMLAKSYDKDGQHIKFPCYLQSKIDGLRCLAKRTKNGVELISRQGKLFKSIPHIAKQLMFLKEGEILDGELYIHGEEFQEIISAVKRDKPSDKSANIEYHIYDIISNEGYEARKELIHNYMYAYLATSHLVCVLSYEIKTKEEIWQYHKTLTARGYEGVMLRNKTGSYKIGVRSSDLQKVKKFLDMEFEIVGAEENKGKMKNQCSFLCKTKQGKTFGVKPKGTDEQRKKYWQDWKAGKLKGKQLTVRFFAWTTSDKPVPRFPVGIAIRDYE